MKHLITILFLTLPIAAQMTVRPIDLPKIVETEPGLVPATSTTVTTATTWITMLTLSNTSDSAVSCTVADRQSTPRAVVGPDLIVSAKSIYIMSFPEGRKALSGVTWACSSGAAIVGYLVGRQQ